ncbi:putative metal-binding protein [Rhizobium leguminosarum bv. trifolii WSM2012]|nr:putative metal-binding protein [Rhizobium leguminosarum bv. trifolii WSM2012]
MHRRSFIAMAASALALGGRANAAAPGKMTVYKDPNCGCCHEWAKAMTAAGYSVDLRDTDDLAAVKARLAVPARLQGCHTAVFEGYYLEGHVPLQAFNACCGSGQWSEGWLCRACRPARWEWETIRRRPMMSTRSPLTAGRLRVHGSWSEEGLTLLRKPEPCTMRPKDRASNPFRALPKHPRDSRRA